MNDEAMTEREDALFVGSMTMETEDLIIAGLGKAGRISLRAAVAPSRRLLCTHDTIDSTGYTELSPPRG